MDLREAIYKSTVRPAQVIHKFPELGTLGEGKTADIAVFKLRRGVFGFSDAKRRRLLGTQRLEAVLTAAALLAGLGKFSAGNLLRRQFQHGLNGGAAGDVVRNGKLVFDADGLAFPDWRTAGEYTSIP